MTTPDFSVDHVRHTDHLLFWDPTPHTFPRPIALVPA